MEVIPLLTLFRLGAGGDSGPLPPKIKKPGLNRVDYLFGKQSLGPNVLDSGICPPLCRPNYIKKKTE